MDSLIAWLYQVINNLLQYLTDFVLFLISKLRDMALWLFSAFLDGLVYVVNLIPVPDFVTSGLQSVTSSLSPLILYALSHSGVATALSIIGAAYGIRLVRKFATLFQW